MRRSLLVTFVVLGVLLRAAHADDELPNAVPSVMSKRWSAAFALGPSMLRARGDGSTNELVAFFDFGLRYRVIAPLEIGAAMGGAVISAVGYVHLFADLRYRPLAEAEWNPIVLVSLGAGTFGAPDPFRLAARGGLGIERRYVSWAFTADVQLAWVAGDGNTPVNGRFRDLLHYGAWSGSFSLAAVYYFGFGASRSRRRVP